MKSLKKLREKAGLTQVQLAKITGYSRRQIQRYEDGARMRNIVAAMFISLLRQK